MHRIPENFDASVFVGATLATVEFGPFKVHFTFEGDQPLWIAVEGSYEHAGPESEGWTDEVRLPVGVSRLMQLTNHAVVEAARLDAERLRLDFDHGHALTLIDDTDQYESFQIAARGRYWSSSQDCCFDAGPQSPAGPDVPAEDPPAVYALVMRIGGREAQ